MKLSFLFLLVFGFAHSAHAVSLGDSATYQIRKGGNTYTAINTVTQISGDTLTVSTVTTATGEPSIDTASISGINDMNSVFPVCEQVGGKYVPVITQSGTFQTCHLVTENQDTYFSPDVTFGIVKGTVTDNGETMEFMLTSFTKK